MTATQNDGFTQTTATGGETTIDFDFLIYGKDDIAFYKTSTVGVISLLTRVTNYNIADSELNDPAGGTITLVAPAVAGEKYTAISDIAETRSSDFQQGGDFFSQTLNTNLDRLTRVTQQLRRDVDKKAGLPVDSTLAGITFTDAPQDGYGVVWDGVLGNFRNTTTSLVLLETYGAALGPIAPAISTVASISGNVTTVAGISANVTTVASISANVTTVANISANVTTVAGISAAVSTVATNAAAVATCAAAIASIIAAPDYATEAFNWAQYAEDTLVPEGNGSQYSAYHWAQKAAAIVNGDLAGLSVLGRSANTTGATAAITAASDYQILRRSGTSVAFGAINLASSNAVSGQLTVPNGGTGVATTTAYAVLCGGTTSTGALQSVASVGTAGQVLTSNGAGALPTFQNSSAAGRLIDVQVFTASGTWTKPAGTVAVEVWVVGGGGGGGGASANNGTTGGTSSFGAFCSATGGTGGEASQGTPGSGGVGSGGTLNFKGDSGGTGFETASSLAMSGPGGSSMFGGGGKSSLSAATGEAGGNYGGGGAGGTNGSTEEGTGGGGGGTAYEYITAALGSTETVTVGAGGPGGAAGTQAGGAGAGGLVIVKSYS